MNAPRALPPGPWRIDFTGRIVAANGEVLASPHYNGANSHVPVLAAALELLEALEAAAHSGIIDHDGEPQRARLAINLARGRGIGALLAEAPAPVPLQIGQLWRSQRGPWPSDKAPVRIVDVLDGWVRYYVNEYLTDERAREEDFRRYFPQIYTGAIDEGLAA